MLINETGTSRQIEFTPAISRALLGAAAILIIAVIGLTVWSIKSSGSRSANSAKPDPALTAKLQGLQEEIRKKDADMATLEQRIAEFKERPTPSSSGLALGPAPSAHTEKEESPWAGLSGSQHAATKSSQPAPEPNDEDAGLGGSPLTEGLNSGPKSGTTVAEKPAPETHEPPAKQARVSFNAQDVTAFAANQNGGTVSFKLVKDQPDHRFAGYLFVFVEMTDARGENKIYVYPKIARLGDEDLPSDFHEGESLSFKYNSRVELPYSDIRPAATINRISILLYGSDGKIVFQRGFERKEIKMVHGSSKANTAEGARQKGSEKRRAL